VKISSESLMNLLAPLKAADTAREDRLKIAAEARLREAKAATETLKARSNQASEERKAAARQKIEQLKARLQMLRSMVGADPKGTARIAAQIARELGAAVKEYAAAGGVTSGMGMGAGGAPAAPASGSDAAGTQGDAAAGGGEGSPVASGDQTPTGETRTGDADAGKEDAGKSANPYQQAIDEQKAQVADVARRSGQQQADNELMADVRKMAAELKALVHQATERAKAGADDAMSPQEAAELEKAVAEMDRQVGQAGADLGGGLVSLIV
jgi:hypothetical protein